MKKRLTKTREAHTAIPPKIGFTESNYDSRSYVASGDFYGSGKKNPIGKVRSPTVGQEHLSNTKLRTPPKKIG